MYVLQDFIKCKKHAYKGQVLEFKCNLCGFNHDIKVGIKKAGLRIL